MCLGGRGGTELECLAGQVVQHTRSWMWALRRWCEQVRACASVVIRRARRLCVLPGDNIASVLAAHSCKANRAIIVLKRYVLMG